MFLEIANGSAQLNKMTTRVAQLIGCLPLNQRGSWGFYFFFHSSPELKVGYCHQPMSVVPRPSCVVNSLVWSIAQWTSSTYGGPRVQNGLATGSLEVKNKINLKIFSCRTARLRCLNLAETLASKIVNPGSEMAMQRVEVKVPGSKMVPHGEALVWSIEIHIKY